MNRRGREILAVSCMRESRPNAIAPADAVWSQRVSGQHAAPWCGRGGERVPNATFRAGFEKGFTRGARKKGAAAGLLWNLRAYSVLFTHQTMKLPWICPVGVVLFFGGCASVAERPTVREQITQRDETRTKTFAASPRLVYEGVRAAAGQMGYRFVRGGPAQGEFDAVSAIGQADGTRNSRQVAMKVRLRSSLDGGTEITIRLTEVIEMDSTGRGGMATETPLRDTPQYEVFFRRVEQALAAAKAETK